MSKEMSREDAERLLYERILNESWSEVSQYTKEIEEIVDRGTIESENDLPLLLAAAGVFIQRATVIEAENAVYEEAYSSLSPCGKHPHSHCPCARSICLLKLNS